MAELPRLLHHHRTRAFDGQAVHVVELLRAWRALGGEAVEAALVPRPAEDAAERRGFLAGLRLPRLAMEILERAYDLRGVPLVLRTAESFGPDLLYERQALHCRTACKAARRLGLPWFLEVNAPLPDEMAALGRLRFPAAARRWEREVLAAADRVLAVSGVLAAHCLRRGAAEDRVLVVPNGADLAAFADLEERSSAWRARAVADGLLPPDACVLGFIGFARHWHRLDLALKALARLRVPGRRPILLVLGEGPALPGLRRLAQELGVATRLRVTGPLPRAAVPPVVGAMDVVLIPAINPYASPLKLFDALAAARPVLAPDQPNLRELVEDGREAFLFRPGDEADFARRLHEVLRDPAGARRVGEAGRALLERRELTWTGNARRIAAAWREVARG